MNISEFEYKLYAKLHYLRYLKHRDKMSVADYFQQYKSYNHSLNNVSNRINPGNYIAARPNPGAGIGHQIANWMAGYYCAKFFELQFAHIPFSNDKHPFMANKWDDYLGFGEGEVMYSSLLKRGYKKIILPLFDFEDKEQVDRIRRIISSYSDEKVVFLCEQDQFLKDLYLIQDDLQDKFKNAPSRALDSMQYGDDKFNVAIHVRRTVVIDNKVIVENEEIKAKRWLSNNYYECVLKQVLENIHPMKPIAIWIFSTGKAEEFADFAQYGDVHFCSGMDEYSSFSHLVNADLLITSKSSFSYKPALFNRGIKVCPKNFWHGYPDSKDWILCDNDGSFDVEKLRELF